MGLSVQEVSAVVFRRVSSRGAEELASDQTAMHVLRLLDGKRDLATVARFARLEIAAAIKVVSKLCKLKLAEPAGVNPRSKKAVDGDFVKQLMANYSLAVGPIAHVMVEDAIADLGYVPDTLPESMVEHLVHQLADDVPDLERRKQFRAAMRSWISDSKD